MITLSASTRVPCTKDELKSCLLRLDEIYPRYSPEEHIGCRYLRGDPLTVGSVLAFEERIAGKFYRLRYRVARVEEDAESIRAVLKAEFPRSLLNISAEFAAVRFDGGVEFYRVIRAGFDHPPLGPAFDAVLYLVLGREYVAAMIEHSREDLQALGEYFAKRVARGGDEGRPSTVDHR
jgi:hypothetical protein